MRRTVVCGLTGLWFFAGCASGTAPDGLDFQGSGGADAGAPMVLGGDSGTPALDSGNQTPTLPGTSGGGSSGSGSTGGGGKTTPSTVEDSGSTSIPTSPDPEDSGFGSTEDAASTEDASSTEDAADDDSGSTADCKGYAPPAAKADCKGCSSSSSTCQPNGCYGGYWCDTSTNKCHSTAPSGC